MTSFFLVKFVLVSERGLLTVGVYRLALLVKIFVVFLYRPVVLRFFLLLLETRMKMAMMTTMMRMMPAIAIPMAKLLCEIQNLSGSYSR